MPIVTPTGAPMPRAMLGYDGTDFYVVRTDATGNLQIDVLASALPAGAATAAHQVTMITALQLIDDLRGALDSVGTDELDVNVDASVLPTGASTAAHQVTQNTALQLIDNLVGALRSVNTDRLVVRGENQLFSFHSVLGEQRSAVVSGAGGYVDSDACDAGWFWCITNICAYDLTSPTTRHAYALRHDGASYNIGHTVAAIAAASPSYWNHWVWMDHLDVIRVYFEGSLVGDTCYVELSGYRFSVEV